MFISAKFNPDHNRAYTYAYDGPEKFAPGDKVKVETKDGCKTVTVHEVDLPEPSFECKAILGRAEEADDAGAALRDWKDKNEGLIAVADAVSRGQIGHNGAPNDLDEALAPYGDFITEAEAWLDGSPVESAGQMKAIDALTKEIKAARKAVAAAEESAAKPLYDAWKNEKAKFAPTLTDLDRIVKGLVSLVGDFKAKLAAEKEAERKAAQKAAWEAEAKAREAAREAQAGDIEAQREADALAEAFKDAQKAASAAAKDTVKGMRKVVRYEITDHRALLRWIAVNRRDDVTAFVEEWARRNHAIGLNADGLNVFETKEAF